MLRLSVALAILAITSSLPAYSQSVVSFPHNYGEPSGDLSPDWQDYFQVKDPLPNVSFPLGRNWAGSIPVGRANQPNDTLFFWAFEKENGSFTAESTEPWGIWLNGGPGLSSLTGLFFENGPLHITSDSSVVANNYSWDKIADYIWVDQPVGVGYSTVQKDGNVANEDELSDDFLGFLTNLVKVFPNLKSRPLYLTGEDYAGKYIPYIAKAYFGLVDPPVNLTKIALGNPTLGSVIEFENLPTLSVIETFPQIIGYDTEVYQYFKEQSHLCGYDLNLTYPQDGKFPTLNLAVVPSIGTTNAAASAQRKLKTKIFKNTLNAGMFPRHEVIGAGSEHGNEQLARRDAWKRDLTGRPNGTIDPFYGCDLWFELVEYAINYTIPWKGRYLTDIDFGNLQDALFPHAAEDASIFLNDNQTRAAIHAPTSKQWFSAEHYQFAGSTDDADPSIEPMAFLDDLAANASEHGVGVVIYSRNEDSEIAHFGSQVVIQNTTFGGTQGFSRPPSTPWFDDDGDFAGIVHQERNWTYALIQGAGSSVSQSQQQLQKAFVLFREFVFGSNTTGLVLTTTNHSTDNKSVVGGENATLADPILPAPPEIYVGSGTTQSTFVYPSETIAAWDSFFATARGTATSGFSGTAPSATQRSGCVGSKGNGMVRVVMGVAAVLVVSVVMVGTEACELVAISSLSNA